MEPSQFETEIGMYIDTNKKLKADLDILRGHVEGFRDMLDFFSSASIRDFHKAPVPVELPSADELNELVRRVASTFRDRLVREDKLRSKGLDLRAADEFQFKDLGLRASEGD